MPSITNNQGKDLSVLLADKYEWELLVEENPELDELFAEAPLDNYDTFLTTLLENGYDYDPEWDFYLTGSVLSSSAFNYLTKHGMAPSDIPSTAPDLGTPELDPFQNELTDYELGPILE